MRLLTSNEEGELSLIERTGDGIPKYAVLSHTWITDGEVSYTEFLDGSGKDKPGYAKIEFCVAQAARDGLHYSWVDTCCIDKWNKLELSDAINNMHTWYQRASRCYTLLADVPEDKTTSDIFGSIEWQNDLRKARWFTRGWTLQELLAPRNVEFFSWNSDKPQRLGDKMSLTELICEITSIPSDALQGDSLDTFTIEQRMDWAAKRQTTEEEDAAYCLLGILGLQMATDYGEGKASAFKRLRRELKPADSALFIVPYERNARFTGRESLLTLLHDSLDRGSCRIAITGERGMGKTQLALELAYSIRQRDKDRKVLWMSAADNESLHQGYMHVAQRLGIPGWNDQRSDLKTLVKDYLSQESVGRWLLIFDNADDLTLWTAQPESGLVGDDLLQDLPSSRQGCILFTTRESATAVVLGAENNVEVPRMSQDIALALLKKIWTNRNLEEELQTAYLLLKKLNYMPLAINLAGSYLNINNQTTLTEYTSLLATHRGQTAGLLNDDIGETARPVPQPTDQQSMAAPWLISFSQICSQSMLAADCMFFMSCVEARDVPLSLLPLPFNASTTDDVVKLLAN